MSYDGQVSASVCVPSGPGTCQGGALPGSTASKTFPRAGVKSWRIDLNLTWVPATPATDRLRLEAAPYEACEGSGGCIATTAAGIGITGTGPLRLVGTFAATEGAEGVWVIIDVPLESTPAGLAGANTPQDVHIEGTMWATA